MKLFLSACLIGVKNEVEETADDKSKKNKNKAKLNLTVREEQMVSLENGSVSNLIEVMADE